MQLSYAQNLEDYHLDLVFGDQGEGTYVDVGGGHPVADNVSFWFYLKGWRGLVVEPQEALADIYRGVRPRDHTVSCLAGRADGEAEFHEVDRLHGFSTTVREHAAGAARFGAGYTTVRKPVRTLASLCAEARLRGIDFLKIDVEGAEADVIAGMDFARWRPRVVVVEAVAPGSMAEAWGVWEPALLAAGYRFVFFDRLNRFYVADEAAELARRFPPEPAPWDRVQHLWDFGRAPERPDHPDHVLATLLHGGLFCELPFLEIPVIERLVSSGLEAAGAGAGAEEPAGSRTTDLAALLFAALPSLEPALLERLVARGLEATGAGPFSATTVEKLVGPAELPRARTRAPDLASLLRTDELRAALGRIACRYDGGLPD